MKYLLPLIFLYSSALGQQLPTGPLQFVKDTKTVTVKQDTVTPGNSIALPVGVFGTVTVSGTVAATQSGVWTTGRTWSLLDSTDSISSFLKDGAGNSITSTAGALDVNIASGTVSVTNPSVAVTGGAVPGSATYIGANKSGNIVAPTLDASDNLNVNVQTSALPTGAATEATLSSIDGNIIKADTDNVTIASSALPTGAATEATLSSVNSKIPSNLTVTANRLDVDGSGVTQPVSAASLPLPTGAATNADQTSGNQKTQIVQGGNTATVTASSALKVDGSAVTQPVSGTVTVSNPGLTDAELRASAVPVSVASLPLPTGAATEAKQDTGNSSLSSIDGKIANNYGVATGAVRTASQIGNASGVADFNAGNVSAQTLRTVIASDQAAIATKAPVNSSASTSSASISSVTTITAPANAVEVIIQADDTNTANLRFAINATATTSSGIQLQPGRSETLKSGANISIIPESGTQKYNVIYITQ